MIIAYCEKINSRLEIDGVVRDSGSLFDWYLIGIGMGFSTCCLLVHAQSDTDAFDAYADSKYGHLTAIDQKDMNDYDPDYINYLGNEGNPHQLDEIRIFERIDKSQIHWFHKKIDLSFDPKRNQSFTKEDFIRS